MLLVLQTQLLKAIVYHIFTAYWLCKAVTEGSLVCTIFVTSAGAVSPSHGGPANPSVSLLPGVEPIRTWGGGLNTGGGLEYRAARGKEPPWAGSSLPTCLTTTNTLQGYVLLPHWPTPLDCGSSLQVHTGLALCINEYI